MAITKEEARRRTQANVKYVGEEKGAYIFSDKDIPEEADCNGRIWVMKKSGIVTRNPFEYMRLRDQGK